MRNKNLALVIAVTGLLCVGVMGCGKRTDRIGKSKVPEGVTQRFEFLAGKRFGELYQRGYHYEK